MTSSSFDSQGSMAFVLPKTYADAPPSPLAGSNITIDKVPARLVATKPFPGIVTEDEIQRQKAALLDAIVADGSTTPVDESQVIVLQYNSPLTVPWRRRNEIAFVVAEKPANNTSTEVEGKVEGVVQNAGEVESPAEPNVTVAAQVGANPNVTSSQ